MAKLVTQLDSCRINVDPKQLSSRGLGNKSADFALLSKVSFCAPN